MKQNATLKPVVRICLTLILLLIIGGGCLIFVKAIRGVGEAQESGSWPTAAGRIVRSEMDVETRDEHISKQSRSDARFYTAGIEYEFDVNGVLYRGSRIAAVQDMNADREHVLKVLNKYPLDGAVAVSYNPNDPGVCVLEPGSWGGVGVMMGLGTVFTLLPLGLLIAVWRTGTGAAKTQSSVITDSTAHSSRTRIGISTLLLLFIGAGSVPLTWAVQGIREAGASLTWPTAPGKITRSEVGVTTTRTRQRANFDRTSRSYAAEIEYEFEAEGTTWHGSRVAVESIEFGDESAARAACEKYSLHKAVTVSYQPGNPGECVLEPGKWGGIGFQLSFAAVFILVPLLLLKAIWTSATKGHDAERTRNGLVFRERFIEWEPGQLIHVRRDRAGFLVVLIGAIVGGLTLGLLVSLFPTVGLLAFRDSVPRIVARNGIWFIANIFAAASVVSALGVLVWGLLDGRGRETEIDWARGSFRGRIGWGTYECAIDQIGSLTLSLPAVNVPPVNSGSSVGHESKYAARLVVHVAGRKFILLETEFAGQNRKIVRKQLLPLIEQLSSELKVEWKEA